MYYSSKEPVGLGELNKKKNWSSRTIIKDIVFLLFAPGKACVRLGYGCVLGGFGCYSTVEKLIIMTSRSVLLLYRILWYG